MVASRQFKTVHDHSLRAEIRLYALYRTLEAVVLMAMSLRFGDTGKPLALTANLAYLLVALLFVGLAYTRIPASRQIVLGTLLDLVFINLLAWLSPQAIEIVAPMWMLNVAAGALLVSLTFGLSMAVASGLMLVLLAPGDWNYHILYGLIYIAIALLASRLGKHISHSDQVTEQQSIEIAELSRMNSLILERLPVGVLVINEKGRIRTSNQVAKRLLRLDPLPTTEEVLDLRSPPLSRKLQQWRSGLPQDQELLSFRHDDAKVEPQFFRLTPKSDEVLIFLNDTSQAARRAETMTLATLGRFSASLAHEIRNPLSAINYAAQLLEESNHLDLMDRKMLGIIQQQVRRTNGIINSVLGLAKREPAKPQQFDLCQMLHHFAAEYRAGFPLDNDTLTLDIPESRILVNADSNHIYQILMVLISNARYYGRMPDQPAHMTLRVLTQGNTCMIEVLDRGPGMSESAARNLFKPFYTTSSHGTGLGLYIARELAQSNNGDLKYLRRNNGACFQLSIPIAQGKKTHEKTH
ncbi:MAG: histidine kinase dimerization/phospho-acceptor domain-containing protein [Pseudomonadota bacterium]|nr:histidine kinase dimerization/phospho-acceptor domain-containing protein [Pseudomonadota bacterium]